jgi:hypothetical protein
MEEPTPKIMLEFLATLPIGHQLTMVAKKADPIQWRGYEYAVNVGPAAGGPIDAYHIDCSVIDAPIDLCLCDELFEGSDGTYIVGNYGWERMPDA